MMEPSNYQRAVYADMAKGNGNTAIVAVAGSGKTTTAINGIGFISICDRVLLTAFNSSIRDEFKRKGEEKGYKHVTYMNYNGFGWGICMRNMRKKPQLDEYKTENVLEHIVLKPNSDEELARFRIFVNPIKRIVSLLKCFNIHSPEEANKTYDDIVDRYNIDEPEDKTFRQVCLDTFNECINHEAHFDFDDQKYMVIHKDLPIPQYDHVIVDEFQDTCPLELELLTGAARNGRFYGIGDPDQAIYGFKGATPDAFDNYIREFRAKELPLSICYRCPVAVINEAKRIVPRIEAAPNAIKGFVDTIKQDKFFDRVQEKDFVLCRTTNELVSTCLKLIKEGKKAKVRGRDFGDSITSLVKRIGLNLHIDKFLPALTAYRMQRVSQLKREREILAFEDRCDTVVALAEGCSWANEILKRSEDIFTDKPHTGVDLMTCHKSKGLQAKNVFVIRPDLLPHPKALEREWSAKEEDRLKYVTITRAEENLMWVEPPKR